jgi:hypothetical protein
LSAPKSDTTPLKANSLRDSLAKTVRLLTKSGIEVNFRGHQPYVASKGNKAIRLVLPEINDNADPALIEAIQGFLDHEVGHIYYTPFARAQKAGSGSRAKAGLLNLIEDIRLEKLLPRDLPGTKENLERMYEKAMPTFFGPPALEAHKASNPSTAFNCVFIVALRALSGQKAFQTFMDDNKLWPYVKPLLTKMPNISRVLRELETYDDVEEAVDAIIDALRPPPPPEPEKEDERDEDLSPPQSPCGQGGGDDDDDADADADQDGDEDGEGGEGHGDGEGTDDGEDEDGGSCAGGPGGDDGDPSDKAGDEDGGDGDDSADGDDADGDDKGDETSSTDTGAPDPLGGGGGKSNKTLTDALKMLDPTPRRAIYLYKKEKKTVAEIAADLQVTEDEAIDLLREARRKLNQILNS